MFAWDFASLFIFKRNAGSCVTFGKELQEKHGLKIYVNDIIIKVVLLFLKVVPEANSYWSDEKGEAVLCD
jgi:pyruvate/2-oxoglutarate dehydrogenase complex dihydrolipoamide acyltransferase (E2) component